MLFILAEHVLGLPFISSTPLVQHGTGTPERHSEGAARNVRAPCKVSIYTRYHPKASGFHPQVFGNTHQSGLRWAFALGKISRNIRKVPVPSMRAPLPVSILDLITGT